MYDLKLAQIRKQSNGEYFSNPNPNLSACSVSVVSALVSCAAMSRSSPG